MPSDIHVVFTAHSLPQRIIDSGDPYPDELRSTAQAVAARVGLEEGNGWSIGWQSAGRTPEPWIGPDILDVIDDLGANGAHRGVIVSAVGFVADHLEVLYDLDIEARARAEFSALSESSSGAFCRQPYDRSGARTNAPSTQPAAPVPQRNPEASAPAKGDA